MEGGIEISIKPLDRPDAGWTNVGTLAPGATFQFGSGITSSKIFNGTITTTHRRDMHPGTLTLADANGNAITIEPTGQNGFTVHTSPDPVRINSKMNETINVHIQRCLYYAKPKPAAELES